MLCCAKYLLKALALSCGVVTYLLPTFSGGHSQDALSHCFYLLIVMSGMLPDHPRSEAILEHKFIENCNISTACDDDRM